MKTPLIILLSLSLVAGAVQAKPKPTIRSMHGCQPAIRFVNEKLSNPPANYPAADVVTVIKGLTAYDAYIQKEIITPGLLAFNGGDAEKAKLMQAQLAQQNQQSLAALRKRFPQNRLFTDFAITINECAKKAVPTGQDLEALKAAVPKIVELARRS